MELTHEEVMNILPHRDPILLIDTVEELIPEEQVTASYHIPENMDIFRGHFPGDPMLPGVYSIECMAQAADIILCAMPRYEGKLPIFLGVNNVRFTAKLRPGDTATVHARLTSERKDKAIATCTAEIYCGETLAACAEVTLAMR